MTQSLCSHIDRRIDVWDLKKFKMVQTCAVCDYDGPNLWICLQRDCFFVACSDQAKDHSTKHFQTNKTHCVHMNISSQRAWCYICEREIIFSKKSSTLASEPIVTTLSDNFECLNSSMGLVGLQNIANTCYMNSALQALSNIEHLTHYFLNCSDLVDNVLDQGAYRCKVGVAKSYQSLLKDIWTKEREIVAPSGILHSIRSVYTMFRGFQQHDTQEFLRCFMDQLHEELKEPKPMSPNFYFLHKQLTPTNTDYDESSSNSRSSTPSDTEYETCDSNYLEIPNYPTGQFNGRFHRVALSSTQTKECSIINEVFDGKLLSAVQCLTCERVSTREETFQDLSLPIPNRDFLNVLHQTHSLSQVQNLPSVDSASFFLGRKWISWMWNYLRSWLWGPSVSLHDCMASFFSADELKGENMYSCEKCNKLRTGVKYSRILYLPEMLCIHLKRFRHDLSYSSKIYSHVNFPLDYLDMGPYLHKDCTSTVALYNLSSVICHHGTVGGGHYTCYARNLLVNKWYEFDDQHVTEVTSEIVQNCQAYVLFYRKHNPHMDLVRAQVQEMTRLEPPNSSDLCFYVSREWLLRLNTFAEPGPINNWTILCPHGGVLQSKMSLFDRIAVPISQSLWDFLYQNFGGGPAINMLFECTVCKSISEALARRQYYELSVFTKCNKRNMRELDSCPIFAISMPWFRNWQQFAHGINNKAPGPIDNSNIVLSADRSQSSTHTSTGVVQLGSDYAQVNSPTWHFLHEVYDGGPEIIIRGALTDKAEIVNQLEYEDNLCENSNGSDTESNVGESKILDLAECDHKQTDECLSGINAKSQNYSKCCKLNLYLKKHKQQLYQNSLKKKLKRNRSSTKNIDFLVFKERFSMHKGCAKENFPIHNVMLHLTENVNNTTAFIKYSKQNKKVRKQFKTQRNDKSFHP